MEKTSMSETRNATANSSLAGGTTDPALAGIEPVSVWRHFGALARIPRKTGNEEGVRAYVKAFAEERRIACEENEVGDLLLRANPDAKGLIVGLQAHMDMVCVSKGDEPYDFANEPIRLKREGDFICADGTSLGADNGIGVAYALALVEEEQGPIEVLLTVDEEEGFSGIEAVAPGWLRAKTLINLDSEEEGYLTIASAGACDFQIRCPVERHELEVPVAPIALKVDGLKGGHSGMEIHRERTNALKVVGKLLSIAKDCGGVVYGVGGGLAPNVIPSEAKAVVGVPPERVAELEKRTAELVQTLITEEDPTLRVDLATTQESRKPLTNESSDRLIQLIDQVPSGILVASPRDPAQPFVSNNLGIVKELPDGAFQLTLMSRSPASEELEGLADRFGEVAKRNGGELDAGKLVAGWAPDYESPLLARFRRKYKEQYGEDAKILEIHAGLECGALQGKYPGMDLISVGPDITGAHSTEEKVSVASTRRTFDLVRAVIQELHEAAPTE
jgi:dipeptidase D